MQNKLTKEQFLERLKTDKKFYEKYGHKKGVDQIQNALKDLINNPDSRRIMVTAWKVDEIWRMALPPCHYGFQLETHDLTYQERLDIACKKENDIIPVIPMYPTEEQMVEWMDEKSIPKRKVSLLWTQRSVDTLLGLPMNIASYALLLMIFAKFANMVPNELICSLGDTHIYSNHLSYVEEQITRKPYKLPTVDIKWPAQFNSNELILPELTYSDFILSDYQNYPNWTGENKPKISV